MDYRDPFASSLAGQLDSMTVELFVRQYSDNQNMIDMINAGCRGVLGCDMTQVSALYFVAYAASAGGLMKLVLAEENSAQGFNVAGGTQQVRGLGTMPLKTQSNFNKFSLTEVFHSYTIVYILQMSLKMAAELGMNNIILGKRATIISQDSEISTVECEDGSKYSAKHVITTTSGTVITE